MNIFVFDIETIPDIQAGKKLYGLDGLDDADVANALFTLRRQASHGSDFMRHHLHQIVAISVVLHTQNAIKVWSLGETDSDEANLLQRFFKGIEKFDPILVSWNGSGFDLPVIHYRSLIHGVSAPRYWEVGDHDQSFRWNNYLNRYHYRHTDLMDLIAGYQARASAPLDEIATMLDFPGKMGMHGGKVWDSYLAGEIEAIRNYCETDVLNTFLVYNRFQLITGKITPEQYQSVCQELKDSLKREDKPHLNEFVQTWDSASE